MAEIKDAIRGLADVMVARFSPPEFWPGCEVKSVTDKDEYTTNNGWIEAVVGPHGQQRVRYFGFPPNAGTSNFFVDVEYFPTHQIYQVFNPNQAGTATVGGIKVSEVWLSDFSGTALYTDTGGTVFYPASTIEMQDSDSTARITLDPGTPSTEAFWETRDQTGALKLRLSTDNLYRFLVSSGGVDTNQNIFQVDVTGSPTLIWDETNDRFKWNKGAEHTAGDVLVSGGSAQANAYGSVVKNTSGAAASAGDVGYIDSAGEYKTTITEFADVEWCVVLVGGANNADIYVARRGRVTVNYTGSAPSTGDFLVTSTTAGSAQAQTTMRPEIFAVCLANGSGGTVSALLYTQRIRKPLSIANELFQIVNASDSDFVAVVSAAGVSGDKVYHDPPSSGTQDAVTPFANNHISKIVLHNTTQGEEAFIINAGTDGTDDFIQVSNSADISGWVTSDTITARSQTNTSTISSTYFFDMEITDLDSVPPLTTILDIAIHRLVDTGSTGQQGNLHPFEASATPKRKTIRTIQTTSVGGSPGIVRSLPIFQNRYQIEWDASGSGTMQVQLRLEACEVAIP